MCPSTAYRRLTNMRFHNVEEDQFVKLFFAFVLFSREERGSCQGIIFIYERVVSFSMTNRTSLPKEFNSCIVYRFCPTMEALRAKPWTEKAHRPRCHSKQAEKHVTAVEQQTSNKTEEEIRILSNEELLEAIED